jgi:hypothetical protein
MEYEPDPNGPGPPKWSSSLRSQLRKTHVDHLSGISAARSLIIFVEPESLTLQQPLLKQIKNAFDTALDSYECNIFLPPI